jgi:hypothetical protein
MMDYFEQEPAKTGDAPMENGGAVQPASGGDTGMEDEIMVSMHRGDPHGPA